MKKVLVVDDSALMRKLLSGVLHEGGYDVQSARNGREAVEMTLQWQPDVVTLDISMPELDGLTALSLLMAARPTPVVMVSSLSEQGALATFEALALGAVDFIPRPGGSVSPKADDISTMLLDKVRCASQARMVPRGTARRAAPEPVKPYLARPHVAPAPIELPSPAARSALPGNATVPGLVLIGVSTGGPRTLEDILPALPADFPWPVLVAQHMPSNFTDTFARRMDGLCKLDVVEVTTGLTLQPGKVYIGRGGTDLAVASRAGRLHAVPRPETPSVPWHPSVEVMVDSAMQHLSAERLIGVMLTGMGNDGAVAMTRLHAAGGRTIAESADTALVFGMPQELIERGGASLVLPCTGIATQLRSWATRTTGLHLNSES